MTEEALIHFVSTLTPLDTLLLAQICSDNLSVALQSELIAYVSGDRV